LPTGLTGFVKRSADTVQTDGPLVAPNSLGPTEHQSGRVSNHQTLTQLGRQSSPTERLTARYKMCSQLTAVPEVASAEIFQAFIVRLCIPGLFCSTIPMVPLPLESTLEL